MDFIHYSLIPSCGYTQTYMANHNSVSKTILNDKEISFSSKAKKLELAQIFNTQAGYITAYDGCFPKPKQFFFADKH